MNRLTDNLIIVITLLVAGFVGYHEGKEAADRYYAERPVTLIDPIKAYCDSAEKRGYKCFVVQGDSLYGTPPEVTQCPAGQAEMEQPKSNDLGHAFKGTAWDICPTCIFVQQGFGGTTLGQIPQFKGEN